MRVFADSGTPVVFRRGGVIAILAALVLVLAACASARKSELVEGLIKSPGQTAPLIVMRPIEGLPPDRALGFATALVTAAKQRDIALTAAAHPGANFTLVGQFQTMTEMAGVRVVYQWQLLDYAGAMVHSAGGSEGAGLFTGTNAWAAVTPTTLERIAQTTADSLAAKLGQLGFGTRVAAIDMPPPGYFVAAGKGAEREVDMALLDGAGPLDPASDGLGPEADVADGGTALPAAAEPYDIGDEVPAEDGDPVMQQNGKGDFADAEGKPQIRAVAVLPVKGAGAGDAELTAAMRRTLQAAGWPVVNETRPDAIIVAGLVRISDPQGGEQNVSLRWDVKTPAGSPLGDVKQSNKVPAGTFDQGWGTAATDAAEAAASGIFDIVERFR